MHFYFIFDLKSIIMGISNLLGQEINHAHII